MALERTITKQLAGEEDLLLGAGTVDQERYGGTQTITRISLLKHVEDVAALNVLDSDKFFMAMRDDNQSIYHFHAGETLSVDNDLVVAGVGGQWLKTNNRPVSTNSADLLDESAVINYEHFKALGTYVWDTTSGKPLWALGPATTDPWVDATGATIYTPV